MALAAYTLARIRTLQPSLQTITIRFLELCEEQGIPCDIASAYRSPAEQEGLYQDKTKSVTNAPALLSYHNHALAFDAVPKVYLNLPNWNPSGPLWAKIGLIGEGLGLEWGGRWPKPDRPHFQLAAAPIRELKAYYEKFKQVMPITISPTTTAIVMMILIGGVWYFLIRPTLKDTRLL